MYRQAYQRLDRPIAVAALPRTLDKFQCHLPDTAVGGRIDVPLGGRLPIAQSGGFRSRWLLISFGAIAVLFIIALLVPAVLPVNFGGGGQGRADG